MYFILSQVNLELFKVLMSTGFSTTYNPQWEGSKHPLPQAQFCIRFVNTLLDSAVGFMTGPFWIPYFDHRYCTTIGYIFWQEVHYN